MCVLKDLIDKILDEIGLEPINDPWCEEEKASGLPDERLNNSVSDKNRNHSFQSKDKVRKQD